ncbi:MAG: sulfotransferase [Myxococcota bacterium]|nr:sulfotransferase [Myxococcales bacterium]
MPDDIRIDDLASPRLPAEFVAQAKALAPMADALRFEADALVAQACAETGLDDFGEEGWRTGLDVVLRGLREDAELSPVGRLTGHAGCVAFLKNRLLLEDLVKRHPEILDLELLPPVVIAGLPRSGTTHLHNLLGADPLFRSLPWWEALEPVPPPGEVAAPGAPDPRIARAAAGIEARNAVMPYFDAMHEMTVDHVHEEIHLLGIDFGTMFFENMGIGAMPTYRDHYLAEDQTPHYRYLKKVLQVLSWLRGPRRWVLKSPQHLEQFGPLAAVFPDATFVVTHRDPVSTVASFSTMISYTTRMSAAKPDPVFLGHYWADRIETMLRACANDRHLLPPERSMDVLFHEYMGAELETVEAVYALAGLDFGPSSRAAIDDYQRAHPRGRFGRVVYDLADFALDAGELRERFRFYTDRFPVRLES